MLCQLKLFYWLQENLFVKTAATVFTKSDLSLQSCERPCPDDGANGHAGLNEPTVVTGNRCGEKTLDTFFQFFNKLLNS